MSTDSTRQRLTFRLVKYAFYAMAAAAFFPFLAADLQSASETYVEGINLGNVTGALSGAIDHAGWVVLVLALELQTAWLAGRWLNRRNIALLAAVRAVCYLLILSAYSGYTNDYIQHSQFVSYDGDDFCALADSDYSFLEAISEYSPITDKMCGELAGQDIYLMTGTKILATDESRRYTKNSGLIDILNSGVWIIIVVIIEVEIFMRLAGAMNPTLVRDSRYIKAPLYLLLLIIAIYWSFDGFLSDTLDAYMWIIIFGFIEYNLHTWHPHKPTNPAPG